MIGATPDRRRNVATHPGRRERAARAMRTLNDRDCALLALILVERLSLVEASAVLGVPAAEARRRYEAAVMRVRRAVAPIRRRAAQAEPLRRAS